MISPPLPPNEAERVRHLSSYSILDTLPEQDYDDLTALAAAICGVPVSLITFVDEERQWFKSHHGTARNSSPKKFSVCAHAMVSSEEIFVISDLRKDERFHDNPVVTADPPAVFYAGVPLITQKGIPLGTLCVMDHSTRALSEDESIALRTLARQVINLLELRKTRLELERKLTAEVTRAQALERFAHEAAHDIRSPLNQVSALAQLALRVHPDMDKDAARMIMMMQESTEKLNQLVNGLLKSTIEGNIAQRPEAIPVSELVNDLRKLFTISEKCSITYESDTDSVVAVKSQLEQVLVNLVANAIKYNDKEKAEVKISVVRQPGHYEISVSDNGPGIAEELQKKIFTRLETGRAKDKYGNKGYGIGLATVKRVVESMGGEVGVQSRPGSGTRFTFTVPYTIS